MYGDYSHGCQVIFGPGRYYDFLMELDEKASKSGQVCWYYNLVDAAMLATIVKKTGEAT